MRSVLVAPGQTTIFWSELVRIVVLPPVATLNAPVAMTLCDIVKAEPQSWNVRAGVTDGLLSLSRTTVFHFTEPESI